MRSVFRYIVHVAILRPLIKLFSGVTVIGKENLDHLDHYIIVANHNSHLDIFVLFGLLPIRDLCRTHAVAAKSYFSRSRTLLAVVSFLFNPLLIARGETSRTKDRLEELKTMIKNKHNIIIFPEGTRGKPGEMQHFKGGIGRLVSAYPNVPIVPVFLSGTERALPRSSALLLPFWNYVIVGPPQLCSGEHRDITRHLEQALTTLSLSESARKQKRYTKRDRRGRSIAFLGIDGSGKSTTSRVIAQELSGSSPVSRVSDDLELYDQGVLTDLQPFVTDNIRHTISRYAKKAQSLKLYKIPKLAELMLRNHLHHELIRWYVSDTIVLDGSPLLNMIAWAALYHKDAFNDEMCSKAISILTGDTSVISRNDAVYRQFPELVYLKYLRLTSMILPDSVIFIDVTSETACDRIDSRGEQKQVHENREKLSELRGAYLTVCDIIRRKLNIPVLIIDGEKTREEVAALAREFISETISQEA
jgi:1-acyl-sn-glycerol-3-phosphate acyltransferase